MAMAKVFEKGEILAFTAETKATAESGILGATANQLPTSMKALADDLLRRLPGPISAHWPEGESFVQAFAHGSMSVELYAPRGVDPQMPHAQDELYFIHAGSGVLRIGADAHAFRNGMCFFVPAGVDHRFESFTPDFSTWVVFWGPHGGEANVV